MEMESIIINIINSSGEARSLGMEAIGVCKEGDFNRARKMLVETNQKIAEAHKSQTPIIQKEAGGEETRVSLLLVHAQDHLMNAITVKDMANEFIDLYEILKEVKGE